MKIQNHKMKNNYIILLFCLFFAELVSAQPNPGGQSFVSYTSTPECEGSKNGKITITINDNIPQGWSLPFTYRYENLDNGDVGGGACNSGTTFIPNLSSGNYKVFVYLDVSCMATGFVTIAEVANTLDSLFKASSTALKADELVSVCLNFNLPD